MWAPERQNILRMRSPFSPRVLKIGCLLLPIILLLFLSNFLIAQRLFAVSPSGHPLIGGIVGQPFAFAHAVLRRRAPLPSAIANESAAVVIVGGGVAGLVAAWTLRQRGIDAIVLEYEDQPGGNARWGEDGPKGLKYPWGAHYVPIPSRRARSVRVFFESLGLLLVPPLEGHSAANAWNTGQDQTTAADLHADVAPGVPTCMEPTERLFYPGTQHGKQHGEQHGEQHC